MSYKRLIPCIFIYMGKAVTWFRNTEVLADDPVELAKYYSEHGADELIVFNYLLRMKIMMNLLIL